MEWFLGIAVMGVMTVLRLAVPVALTLVVAYLIHRLDVRWHPDASAARAT